jgi:hypothetical protein
MWLVFFWPAFWLLALLKTYAWADYIRNVGVFTKSKVE